MVDDLILAAAVAVSVGLIVGSAAITGRALVKRPDSWLVREVGHRWWSVAVVYLLGCIPLPFGVWDLARVAVGAVTLGIVVGADYAHNKVICGKCIVAWPLDAPARAEQRQGWLRFWHTSRILIIGALVGVLLLAHYVPFPTLAQAAVFATAISLHDRARSIHAPLQPWCPTCGDDDGGGDDEAVAPEPDPADARQ